MRDDASFAVLASPHSRDPLPQGRLPSSMRFVGWKVFQSLRGCQDLMNLFRPEPSETGFGLGPRYPWKAKRVPFFGGADQRRLPAKVARTLIRRCRSPQRRFLFVLAEGSVYSTCPNCFKSSGPSF